LDKRREHSLGRKLYRETGSYAKRYCTYPMWGGGLLVMKKIELDEVKDLAEKYDLKPCRVPETKGVQIRKHGSPNLEDISWEEFENTLKKRKLAVYKAEKSDFLKIMKDK
jgi:hypothetical protein